MLVVNLLFYSFKFVFYGFVCDIGIGVCKVFFLLVGAIVWVVEGIGGRFARRGFFFGLGAFFLRFVFLGLGRR